MRKLILIASAAAMAASMPALGKPGGNGGGNGNGGQGAGQEQARGKGGGGGGAGAQQSGGGHGQHQARGGGGNKGQQHARGGGGSQGQNQARGGHLEARGKGSARGAERPARAQHAERQARHARAEDRHGGKGQARSMGQANRQDSFVRERDDRRLGVDRFQQERFGGRAASASRSDCPPGLAKKNNGCLPPGQAARAFAVGQRIEPSWFSGYDVPRNYSGFYYDTPDSYYRYSGDGFIYRVDSQSNLISALIPLLGGGFAVGQPLPAGYDVYNVPLQYRDQYYDSDEAYYRYGDEAIYRVNPQSGVIESIVALLAGDLNVGQQLPAGYDVYNLPMEYRDQYQDTDESLYRYGDGNIYQVDAKTQIIQAIIQALI